MYADSKWLKIKLTNHEKQKNSCGIINIPVLGIGNRNIDSSEGNLFLKKRPAFAGECKENWS